MRLVLALHQRLPIHWRWRPEYGIRAGIKPFSRLFTADVYEGGGFVLWKAPGNLHKTVVLLYMFRRESHSVSLVLSCRSQHDVGLGSRDVLCDRIPSDRSPAFRLPLFLFCLPVDGQNGRMHIAGRCSNIRGPAAVDSSEFKRMSSDHGRVASRFGRMGGMVTGGDMRIYTLQESTSRKRRDHL